VNAVRKLPDQQQEAFLLTHAQRWNTRLCAVAMDCSTQAVETHLAEAQRQVRPLFNEAYEPLLSFLHQVHRTLAVDVPSSPRVAAAIVARRGASLMMRMLGWAVIVAIVAGIVGVIVFVVPRIDV
jgi:hypothetical protein